MMRRESFNIVKAERLHENPSRYPVGFDVSASERMLFSATFYCRVAVQES